VVFSELESLSDNICKGIDEELEELPDYAVVVDFHEFSEDKEH
jgi:hypothetical protein